MLALLTAHSLTTSLEARHFDVTTGFGPLGNTFEAVRLFDDGHYFLLNGSLDSKEPLNLEIFSNGFRHDRTFPVNTESDLEKLFAFCDDYQDPFGWE